MQFFHIFFQPSLHQCRLQLFLIRSGSTVLTRVLSTALLQALYIRSLNSSGFNLEWRIQTIVTWWCGKGISQNIKASWLLALFFAVCSSAASWQRHRRCWTTTQSAFIGSSSLMSGPLGLRLRATVESTDFGTGVSFPKSTSAHSDRDRVLSLTVSECQTYAVNSLLHVYDGMCSSASTCRPHSRMWVCRWVRATRTHYLYDGFSFLHHPISNHFCLSPTEPSHVSRARHKIPGHFLLQRGMIHISYIACKSLGQNCFDEALEVAGGQIGSVPDAYCT